LVKINMLGLGGGKNIRSYSSKESIWIEYKKREFKNGKSGLGEYEPASGGC